MVPELDATDLDAELGLSCHRVEVAPPASDVVPAPPPPPDLGCAAVPRASRPTSAPCTLRYNFLGI